MDLEKTLSWTQPHQPLPEEVCIYYVGHEANSFCHFKGCQGFTFAFCGDDVELVGTSCALKGLNS